MEIVVNVKAELLGRSELADRLFDEIDSLEIGELHGEAVVKAYRVALIRASVGGTLLGAVNCLERIEIWISTPLGAAVLGALISRLVDIAIKYLDVDQKTSGNPNSVEPSAQDRVLIIYGPQGDILKQVRISPPDLRNASDV